MRVHHDRRAGLVEPPRDAAADVPARARDDRDAAGQIEQAADRWRGRRHGGDPTGSVARIDPTVQRLIERFGLTPLPVEGTLFAETYKSEATAASGGPAGTAGIGLFCDDPLSRSLFHRLAFDEVWHFYAGDSLRLVLLHPDGSDEEVVLGGDVVDGARLQHVVPAGVWQAGELVAGRTRGRSSAARWRPGSRRRASRAGAWTICCGRILRAPPTSSGSPCRRARLRSCPERTLPGCYRQ